MNELEIILVIALIVLLLVIIWLSSKLFHKKKREKLLLDLDMGFEEIPDFYDVEGKVIYFNYERLDDKMKYIYDIIYEGIQQGETLIEVGSCDPEHC